MRPFWNCVGVLCGVALFEFSGIFHSAPASDLSAIQGGVELGILYPLAHTVQFSKDTTRFDYVESGGQDNLFTFIRLELLKRFEDGDRLRFVFQPLELETQVLLQGDINIDGVQFPKNTPVRTLYSFPYYRLSYFWSALETESHSLGLGGGLQIRNARIEFESLDGQVFVSNRDVGPVPLLSLMYHLHLSAGHFFGFEAEGLFAPGKYINGDDDSQVEGAILDSSLRYGWIVGSGQSVSFNVRYLGGGAEGQSDDTTPPGDGFSSNWLQFLTLSLRAEAKI
jgi:hypothetical protein